MNRFKVVEETVQKTIDSGVKPDGSPLGDLVQLEKALALDPIEVVAYQTAQARAFALGKISLEEAQYVYTAIGEGADWPKGTSLARKVAVTQAMAVLMKVR